MARAQTKTLLPLDRWGAIMGINPLHLNQVTVADLAPASQCAQPVLQYDWQNADRIGREAIAIAIAQVEDLLVDWLKFLPMPDWTVDERQAVRQPAVPNLFNTYGTGPRGQWSSVAVGKGHVISGGVRAKSVIQAAAAITYSDVDGDGYSETATISGATTVTDVNEIAVYYPAKSGADEYEIMPLKSVAISGGTVTIVVRREQLVLENLWEEMGSESVDGLVAGNFLTTLDIYRKYNDPQQQVQFLWERQPNYCGCGSGSCDQCGMETQFGCLNARDYRLGMFAMAPATWNSETDQFEGDSWAGYRLPDRVRLWYHSGYRDMNLARPSVMMAPRWERAIAHMSCAFLDRPLCNCNALEDIIKYWREDLAASIATGAESSSFALPGRILDNPFGTTRGAIEAWKLVQREKLD